MSDSPFTTHGDEPVEARIVSWVLGEASAFEAAELERLCEERPELLVFRRRMRALHGLLTEAEAAERDDSWKLPPEKRKALDELFGVEKTGLSDKQREKRIKRSGRRSLLAIAACVILTIVVYQLVQPVWVKSKMARESSTIVNYMASSETAQEARQLGLEKAIRNQEDKVEERRKVLSTIARTKGIIYEGSDSFYGDSDADEGARNALQAFHQLKQEKMQLESQLKSLEKYDSDQLMTYASGLDLPDNTIRNQYPDFQEAKRKLADLKNQGLGEDHPVVKSQMETVDSVRRQLDEGIVGLRESVKARLDQTSDRMMSAEVMKDDSRDEAIKRGLDAQDYADAKSEFEADQELLLAMKLKRADGMIDGQVAEDARESRLRRMELRMPKAAPAKPSVPSASLAKVIAANTSSLQADPVAAIEESASSLAFGDSDDFGAGWGGNVQNGDSGRGAQGVAKESDRKPAPATAPVERGFNDGPAMAGTADPFSDDSSQTNSPAGRPETGRQVDLPSGRAGTTGNRDLLFRSGQDSEERYSGSAQREMNRREKSHTAPADDPIRANPALTDEHAGNVDKIRRSLYAAGGNYNLGKYDEAKESYENTLRIDPYNTAARRGLEKIASAKSDYYRAAYDHTRSELLAQVDNGWELVVPADEEVMLAGEKQLEKKSDALGERVVDEEPKDLAVTRINPMDLIEEIAASEDPYSTFSLNISDASFQVAKAALAKGEQPDPAGIKVEQFYNAVDYGDPAPSAGEPVAVSIEQAANPVIPGRNLVRIALKTAAAGRSAAQPLRLTLLVDQSGSMVREDRRAAMNRALVGLGGLLTKDDLVTVIGFSRTARLLADGMPGDKAGKLADLVNQAANEGGTNLEEAINLAGEKAIDRKLDGAQNRIVLFTDGAANLGDADPGHLAEKVKGLRQKGIAFDIAGIAAEDLNDGLLGELSRNGNGRYYVVGKGGDDDIARQLAGAFRPAAENVKVQVRFNPERVGHYKLIGFEEDRLKTEDFRNDAVDAAELAAEEAGVAVYQVEPLPGGNGELGEVSVRFRDTSSGGMVERSWAIPYDSNAPSLDQSTPSMQLAALSMLAGEKLKGGPLAEAVDFNNFTESQAKVKQFYGNSGRVGEVLGMIDALK